MIACPSGCRSRNPEISSSVGVRLTATPNAAAIFSTSIGALVILFFWSRALTLVSISRRLLIFIMSSGAYGAFNESPFFRRKGRGEAHAHAVQHILSAGKQRSGRNAQYGRNLSECVQEHILAALLDIGQRSSA